MPLEVIGAGCGRTGTASLKRALEILGYKSYHMEEVIGNSDFVFWDKAVQGEQVDFDEVFTKRGFTATVDFPASTFYLELLAKYPDAKVILSTRSPESWFKSVQETIWHPAGLEFNEMGKILPNLPTFISMCKGYRTRMLGPGVDCHKQEETVEAFKAWNAKVIATVPPEKLLVFQAVDGWEPLCKFLGKPIPDEPYPNVNDTAAFKAMVRKVQLALPVVWGVAAGAFCASAFGLARLGLKKNFSRAIAAGSFAVFSFWRLRLA